MIFLKFVFTFLLLISCATAINKSSSSGTGKMNPNAYKFNIDELDFNQKIQMLSTYSESSSTWNKSTWNSVSDANKARRVVIQCLQRPESVDLKIFDELRERFAENFNYWLDKGICQYQKEHFPQSFFSFEFSRRFANDKQKKQIDQWIGGLYFKQGYWNKAIELWTQSKLPNSYQWDSAFARFFNGHMDKSKDYFMKLVKNNQINDSLILALSHIYVAHSEDQKAQLMLEKVSSKGKKLRKSFFYLQAYLLKKSGNLEGLNKILKRAPKKYRAELQEFIKLK